MTTQIHLSVNGEERVLEVSADVTLLWVLRDRLGLTGTKEACGRGECGACTVLLGGRPVMSCCLLAASAQGDVTTIEGLKGDAEDVRRGFADHYGFQCGFCTSGQIVRAHAFLSEAEVEGTAVSRESVGRAMSGNICRCTGYAQIVDAVMTAARERGIAIEGPGPECRAPGLPQTQGPIEEVGS